MNREKKLIKNTLILSLCTMLNKGLMFVMLPLFTRWLTVENYGTYDVLATYISLLIPLITLATNNSIFRLSVDSNDYKKKEYITSGACLYLANAIIAIGILYICHSIFKFNSFKSFLILLIGELLDNFFQGYLRALKKLSLYGMCKTVTVSISAIMIVIFIKILNFGLDGLLIGYALGYYFSAIFIIIKTKFFTYIRLSYYSFERVKELVSYSWALIPNDISWWIINVSDRQIINMFIGSTANGIYAIAYKIPNLCSSIFGVFNISWQESATEALVDIDKEKFYNGIIKKMFSILISLCIGIVACNFLFFDYIFDMRYSDARLYSPILVASIIFSTLSIFYGGIQISLKRPKANGLSTVIGAIVNLGVHLVLVNFIGLYAAAISTLVSNAVVMIIRKYLLQKEFYIRIEKKQYVFVIIFVYFAVAAMMKLSLFVNIINLVIACVLFVFINKEYINKMVKKLR